MPRLSVDIKSVAKISDIQDAFGISRQTFYNYQSSYESDSPVGNELMADFFSKVDSREVKGSNSYEYLKLVKRYTDKLDGKDISVIENEIDDLSKKIDQNDEEIEILKSKTTSSNLEKQEIDESIQKLEDQQDDWVSDRSTLQRQLEFLNDLRFQITSFGEGSNIRETFKPYFDTAEGPLVIVSDHRIMVVFKGSYEECRSVRAVLYIGPKGQQQEIGIYRPEPGRKFAVIDDIVPYREYWIAARKEVRDMEYSTSPLYPIEWSKDSSDKKK